MKYTYYAAFSKKLDETIYKKFVQGLMFPTKGYLQNAVCPYYQYGLCHRPYCHFKHKKKEKIEAKEDNLDTVTSTNVPATQRDEDDLMKIVKNISPSKLIAYAQKRKEEKELQEKLDQIDKENQEKLENESTLSHGLIDTFYSKDTTIGTILTPLLPIIKSEESPKGVSINSNVRTRRICECDDPDCKGYIEDEVENNENNIGIKREEVVFAPDSNEVNNDTNFHYSSDENSDDDELETKRKQEEGKEIVDIDFFAPEELHVKTSKKKKPTRVKVNEPVDKSETLVKVKKEDLYNENEPETTLSDKKVKEKKKKRKKDSGKESLEVSRKRLKLDTKLPAETIQDEETKFEKPVAKFTSSSTADIQSTMGASSVKKRVAHSSEEIVRGRVEKVRLKDKISYVSPGLATSISTSTNGKKSPAIPTVSATVGYSTENGMYVGKKRIAHASFTAKNAGMQTATSTKKEEAEKFVRPKLAVEYNSKIPHVLRQRYLDKIIDEFLPKCKSESEACEEGFAEEAVAFQRSSRKNIYMNLCANIIKKIRTLPDYVAPPEEENNKQLSPFDTGKPTVLSAKKNVLPEVSKRIQTSGISGYKKIEQLNKSKIKAPSSALVNATKVNSQSKKVRLLDRKRTSTEGVELTESNFYRHLKETYLLTEGQRWENKYPRRDPDDESMVLVKDYRPSDNPLKRICCRCGKDYFMNAKGKYKTRDECHYHWGKLRRHREKGTFSSYFSCCQSEANGPPCSMSRLHVCDKIGKLTDYAFTENWSNDDATRKVFSLDCEMCYTTQGLELTRLTVVDFNLDQIIDLFVKPKNPIVDYNTRFSGVTKEDLQDVDTTIDDIHDILSNLLDPTTILMGHSLESDLNALKLVHETVVDTALVFPHRLGLPFKRALRNLMADHLQKIIQDGVDGHDSLEDARACMELMRYRFTEDKKKDSRPNHVTTMSSSSFYTSKH